MQNIGDPTTQQRKEPEFINGLIAKKPTEKAPDFIIANLSIKREELINYLQSKHDEWLNIDVKESRKGTYYAQLNDWKADPRKTNANQPQELVKDKDIPVVEDVKIENNQVPF